MLRRRVTLRVMRITFGRYFLFETPLQITVIFRYADIRVALLPLDTFNDGRWYKMSDSERARLNPVLINNNWIIGKAYHYSCQKTNGNYFGKKKKHVVLLGKHLPYFGKKEFISSNWMHNLFQIHPHTILCSISSSVKSFGMYIHRMLSREIIMDNT